MGKEIKMTKHEKKYMDDGIKCIKKSLTSVGLNGEKVYKLCPEIFQTIFLAGIQYNMDTITKGMKNESRGKN